MDFMYFCQLLYKSIWAIAKFVRQSSWEKQWEHTCAFFLILICLGGFGFHFGYLLYKEGASCLCSDGAVEGLWSFVFLALSQMWWQKKSLYFWYNACSSFLFLVILVSSWARKIVAVPSTGGWICERRVFHSHVNGLILSNPVQTVSLS